MIVVREGAQVFRKADNNVPVRIKQLGLRRDYVVDGFCWHHSYLFIFGHENNVETDTRTASQTKVFSKWSSGVRI